MQSGKSRACRHLVSARTSHPKTSRVLAHISFVLCELSSWGHTKMLEIKREIKRSRITFGGYPTIGPRDGGGRDLEPGPQKTAFHPSHVQKMPLATQGLLLST